MHVQALNLTAKAGPYITWIWKNRKQIVEFPKEGGEFLIALAENGGDAIQRIGSQLVLGSPDGGNRVLAFIDQTSPQLDRVEEAVNGLSSTQTALTSSIASLQAVSMVTLGLSAVTPIVLLAQFRYLSKQFLALKQSIRDLTSIVEKQSAAKLQSGLEVLEQGVKKGDDTMVKNALMPCSESLQFFRGRLEDAIEEQRDHNLVHYLTRHLSIAVSATSRCDMALQHDDIAQEVLETHRETLRKATQLVFEKTVGDDPTRFLVPELAGSVSFDFIRSLFQQADAAGILREDSEMKKAATELSPTAFFEFIRPMLFRSKLGFFGKKKSLEILITDLRQAAAIVEETNRVRSLETFLQKARQTGVRAIDAVKELDQKRKLVGAEFFAWSFEKSGAV